MAPSPGLAAKPPVPNPPVERLSSPSETFKASTQPRPSSRVANFFKSLPDLFKDYQDLKHKDEEMKNLAKFTRPVTGEDHFNPVLPMQTYCDNYANQISTALHGKGATWDAKGLSEHQKAIIQRYLHHLVTDFVECFNEISEDPWVDPAWKTMTPQMVDGLLELARKKPEGH